jgi:hypothetical protein
MRNVSDKSCRENQNTHFVFSNFPSPFHPPPTPTACRLWNNVENTVQPYRPQMTIWRMRVACCETKATNTHSEYVTLIAFPLQQWYSNAPQYYVIPALYYDFFPYISTQSVLFFQCKLPTTKWLFFRNAVKAFSFNLYPANVENKVSS